MKKLILSALLAFAALGAHAQPVHAGLCEALANLAASTAREQILGMPKEAYLIKYAKNFARLPSEGRSVTLAMVETIYANEWAPAEARRIIWSTCLKVE